MVMDNNVVRIFIHISKTVQLGKRQWIVLPSSTKDIICLIFTLHLQYMQPDALLLQVICWYIWMVVNLLHFSLKKFKKKCLACFVFFKFKFILHSFRIGAASVAAQSGLSNDDIGKWGSNCFKLYIWPNLLIWFL